MGKPELYGAIIVPIWSKAEMLEIGQRLTDKDFQFHKHEKLAPLPVGEDVLKELEEFID